jgi:two-component sensor histidine kinase
LIADGTDIDALTRIEAAFRGASVDEPEICYRRNDGSEFWASIFITPVCDEAGKIVHHFVSLIDITKHRDEQAKGKSLINELNQQMTNTLLTVQPLVHEALQNTSVPEIARKSIESRIFALSQSNDADARELERRWAAQPD